MRSWPPVNSRKHSELIAVVNPRDKTSLVRITELHLVDRDRTFLCRSALRAFENETSAMIHGDSFVRAGHRVFDRLESDTEVFAEPSGALEAVDIHAERNELRVQQRAESCRQNFKRQSTGLTRTDLEQGFSLFLGRPFIDKQADCAVAFVDGSWPLRGKRETKAIER